MALNIRLPSQRSTISILCSNSLVCSSLYRGTKLLPLYPHCFPCLSFCSKNSRVVCVNSKLIDNEKVVLNPTVPPSSKEEAVEQVKECLTTLLEKPIRNFGASSVKQRKLRQTRLRVEIPIIDESPSALSSMVAEVLGGLSLKRKGQKPTRIAVFWSDFSTANLGGQAIKKLENVKNLDFSNPDIGLAFVEDLGVLFFVGPGISQLPSIESISKEATPSPVVLFNPNWGPEDEEGVDTNGFLSSFETVYSFTALAIQGFFSKTEGAVFRYVKGAAPKSNPWLIFVKEEGKFKCVARLKKRPDASELENALYNSIALNSPVTKSIKFLRGLIPRTNKKE